MLLLEKEGIVFALVQRRFQSFDQMTKQVHSILQRIAAKPVVIIFPEWVLGEEPVPRIETKEWLASIQPRLRKHGQGFLFFSVLENAPLKKTVTNTGYLVEPFPQGIRRQTGRSWMAYPKIVLAHGDRLVLHNTRRRKAAERHWNQRADRLATRMERLVAFGNTTPVYSQFQFPRTVINGKTIELRVCLDVGEFNRHPADVIVVPSWGLDAPLQHDATLEAIYNSLKRDGFAIINDVTQRRKTPRIVEPLEDKTAGVFPLQKGARNRLLRRK